MDVLDILAVIAPEFAGVDLSGAIAIAELQIGPDMCGDKRPLLVAYLAAHLLTLARRKLGAGGDVAGLKEGALSITYTNGTSKISSGLSNTSYGREYDRLSRGCVFTPRTRMMGMLNRFNNGCC
jgi:hypothetical protein